MNLTASREVADTLTNKLEESKSLVASLRSELAESISKQGATEVELLATLCGNICLPVVTVTVNRVTGRLYLSLPRMGDPYMLTYLDGQ